MKVVAILNLIRTYKFFFIVVFILSLGITRVEAQNQDEFFKNILLDPPERFVVSGLNKIAETGNGKIAIDLGSNVGHETKLLLQKGYKVIAVDSNQRALEYLLLQPGIGKYKSNLTTINSKFEKLNFSKLPRADLIVSSFALPFVSKENFSRIWKSVTSTIKPGGYIIINLFDEDFDFYNNKQQMTFHTQTQARALFANFQIIEFRKMKNDPLKTSSKNYYYVIVAKKLK